MVAWFASCSRLVHGQRYERMRTLENACVTGTGSYLPQFLITNADLESEYSEGPGEKIFNSLWIERNFGITQRYVAYDYRKGIKSELNSDMAAKAIRAAAADAGIEVAAIEMIISSTASPDKPLPPMVTIVQEKLGLKECACIETRSACSGLAQGLLIATQLIRSGEYATIAVVGSEATSAYSEALTNASDLNECVNRVMFGDGAGAFIVQAGKGRGIRTCTLNSVGLGKAAGIEMPFGGSAQPVRTDDKKHTPFFNQDFRAIARSAPQLFERALAELMAKAQLSVSDVTYFVPHQASIRYLRHLQRAFDIPDEKMICDVQRVANTGSASIFIALDRLNREGRLRRGDTVVLLPAEATKWLYGGIVLEWGA